MAKILKNTTINPITIRDVGVILTPTPSSYTVPSQDYDLWAASVDVLPFIENSSIVVNDGYDDLKPINGKRHLQEEGLSRASASIITQESHIVSASGIEYLTADSRLEHVYYGSDTGQVIQLGDARTYNTGHHYKIWNKSTANLFIRDAATNLLATVPPNVVAVEIALVDNSTLAGSWLVSLLEIVTGVGTAATLTFTRNGGMSQAAYFYVGQTLTSYAGYIINGTNYITKMSVTNSTAAASNKFATFKLQRRTGVSTFVDIPNANITIPGGAYSATVNGLLIPIGPDWEISALRISGDGGAGINNPIFNVFIVPQ